MEKLRFRQWLEFANFGFDRPKPPYDPNSGNKPVYELQLDYVNRQLRKSSIGNKMANETMNSGVFWGDGFGAIRVNFTPYGGVRCSIQRQSVDAKGESVWICKKVIDINDYYCKYPDALVVKILDEAKEVDRGDVEVGVTDFTSLEALTKRVGSYIERKMSQRIFQYEGILETKPDREYIVHWGVTGMGVQRRDQHRVDQYQIIIRYEESTGMITIGSVEVDSPIKSHNWQLEPCSFFEFFSPSQSVQEICDSILVHVDNY
jgi:hypothetical protein